MSKLDIALALVSVAFSLAVLVWSINFTHKKHYEALRRQREAHETRRRVLAQLHGKPYVPSPKPLAY